MGKNLSDLFLYVCKCDMDTKNLGVIKIFFENMYPEVRCPVIFKSRFVNFQGFF